MRWSLPLVALSMGNDLASPRAHLPSCDVFLAPSSLPGTGLGVFAGRDFKKDEVVMSSWMTLFLSLDVPQGITTWYYVFGNNDTHVALPLGYGPIANHHSIANARNVWADTAENNIDFTAVDDIAAGQEIFVSYGNAEWFEDKDIPIIDIDYASTQWRPELHPLPCRQNVIQRKGRDGRLRYIVLALYISSGTVLEISLCLEMPTIVVDKYFLWDYALTDPRHERAIGQRPESALIPLSYAAHIPVTHNPDVANVRLLFSDVDREAKGSTNTLVAVVATQDLQKGDELRRLKEETENDFGEDRAAMSDVVDVEAPGGSSVEVFEDVRPSSKPRMQADAENNFNDNIDVHESYQEL